MLVYQQNMSLGDYSIVLRSADCVVYEDNYFTMQIPTIKTGMYRATLKAFVQADTSATTATQVRIQGWGLINHLQSSNDGWFIIGSFDNGLRAECVFYVQDPGTQLSFRYVQETDQGDVLINMPHH